MSSIRRVVYELMPGSVIGTDEQARAGTTTQFKSKRAGTGPALCWSSRSSVCDRIKRALDFARGDIGKSRTLLLLLLRRHDEYPLGLDRLTRHSNLCSRNPRADPPFPYRGLGSFAQQSFLKNDLFFNVLTNVHVSINAGSER
jgi:hypothetical protein